jgi:hypothetical protein
MIIITVSFVTLSVNWYNNRLLPLIRQLFLIPNRINGFVDCSGVELTTDYIKMELLQEGYNPNAKASYSSENVLVSHYKCRKSTEYNGEQKLKYVRNQYRTNRGCFIGNKRGHRAAECYKNP